jgi:hypothetical protein
MPSIEERIDAMLSVLLKRCQKNDIVPDDDGYIDEHHAASLLRLSWDRLRAIRYEGSAPPFRRASRQRVEYHLRDLALFEIERQSEKFP